MVRSSLALSFLLAALLQTAFAAQRGKAALDMQQGRGALATSRFARLPRRRRRNHRYQCGDV